MVPLLIVLAVVVLVVGFVVVGFNKLRTADIGAQEVTRARAGVAAAAGGDDVAARAAADAALQQALVRLNAVAEAYPDLKADQNFAELQRQLAQTEDQIAFSRQYYNDATRTLNTLVATIPWMFLSGVAGVGRREFYDAPQGHQAPPQVSF